MVRFENSFLYPHQLMLSYGQPVWAAVPIDKYPQKGKSIVTTRMKPVILTYLAFEDKDRLAQPTQTAHV